MKISRRSFISGLAYSVVTSAFLGAYGTLLEPYWLEVRRKTIKRFGWPRTIRIAHLTDLHVCDAASLHAARAALAAAQAEHPDLVFLTGDFVTGNVDPLQLYGNSLRTLVGPAPAFACLGNHDGGRWSVRNGGLETSEPIIRLLDSSGIQLLDNENRIITIKGISLQVVGLSDIWGGRPKPDICLKRGWDDKSTTFLLCHNPDAKEAVEEHSWQMMFCGHTHGGQVVVPFINVRPFLPIRDKRFADGLMEWKERLIYISRGVGTLYGLRINCRPDISIIDIS